MTDAPDLRASDADRERVADLLRHHAGEGRLDPEELDERLSRAYTAKTGAELAVLTRDLPSATGVAAVAERRRPHPLVPSLAPLLVPNIVCIAIWAVTDFGGYFWPIWVLLGTGVAAATRVIAYVSGEDEEDEDRAGRDDSSRTGSLPPPPKPPGLP